MLNFLEKVNVCPITDVLNLDNIEYINQKKK